MHVTKPVDLSLLTQELAAASIPVPNGLGYTPTEAVGEGNVYTFDVTGHLVDLPPAAAPVVAAHVAPLSIITRAETTSIDAIIRTTDGNPAVIYRFPSATNRVYQASLILSAVNAADFTTKVLEARFVWKRLIAGVVPSGKVLVSDIHDAAAAAWDINVSASGADVLFQVRGETNKTIDWMLYGSVGSYAPSGLT